jgi:hypothetical protein
MQHGNTSSCRAQSRSNLHGTAGIPGGHRVERRVGSPHGFDLLRENALRHLRLQQRENPRTAAAAVGPGQQAKPEPRDRAQHRHRGLVHPLRVLEMTRGVVGDGEIQRRAPPRATFGQQLAHIADLRGHPRRVLVTEEVPIVLEQRAAARAVHRDVVGGIEQRRQIAPCERTRRAAVSGMLMQGTAAGLACHLDDGVPVDLERAPGRVVHVGEQGVHDAPAEQGDGDFPADCPRPLPPVAAGSGPLPPARSQHSHPEPEAPCPREPRRNAGAAEGPSQSEYRPPECFAREHPEHESPECGQGPRTKELLTRGLESPPVADARRAHRLAAAAPEAGIEMLGQRRIGGGDLAPLQRPHEHDAAAGTVSLIAGDTVGRACRKAETAVNAGIECRESAPRHSSPTIVTRHSPAPPRADARDRTSRAAGPRGGRRLHGRRRSDPRRGAPARARAPA